jgi:MFS family permease
MMSQNIRQILTHDFILVFFGQFASAFIFHILIPTLPIYLSRLGSTEVETGILIGTFFFWSLVFRPFIGKALLKTPEKKFMIIGSLLYAMASVGYLLTTPFWPFLIVRVFHGIGFAFFHTSSFTLVANISSKAHRGQSLTYFALAMTIPAALAPSIGVLLVNHFSFTFLFLVCLGVSLCALFITSRLTSRQIGPLQDSTVEDGFLFNRKVIPPSIISSISLFIYGALAAFFPLYSMQNGVANPGLFFTTIAIMLLLGRSLGGKILDLYDREKVILPCLITYIIAMAILAFSKTLPMFILVAVIWGVGNAFMMPSLVAYALDRVGSSPGPAMGTFTAVSDFGISLGPVIMGVVIQVTGYPIMFLSLAFIGIINLNYFYFFVRGKNI